MVDVASMDELRRRIEELWDHRDTPGWGRVLRPLQEPATVIQSPPDDGCWLPTGRSGGRAGGGLQAMG